MARLFLHNHGFDVIDYLGARRPTAEHIAQRMLDRRE
jgi:hypothetical protein